MKPKETQHFENEEGICTTCVEIGREQREKEIEDIIELYFDGCMLSRKVPKKEELKAKLKGVIK